MNDTFFKLSINKQQRIINAAYKVFSQNSYKKASMSEIAQEGDISKALLFYYFKNKKELYMHLWSYAVEMTRKATSEYHVLDTNDFFEMMYRTLSAKCSLMQKYPYIYAFSLQAYYEPLPEIAVCVQESFTDISKDSQIKVFQKMDTSIFRKDIDLKWMYQDIMYAIDGYLLNKYRSRDINVINIQQDMREQIEFWKKIYTDRGENDGT